MMMTQPASATGALPCVDIHFDDLVMDGSVIRAARGYPGHCWRVPPAPPFPVSRPGVRRCPTKRTRIASTSMTATTTMRTTTKKRTKKTRSEDDDEDEEDEEARTRTKKKKTRTKKTRMRRRRKKRKKKKKMMPLRGNDDIDSSPVATSSVRARPT